MYNILLNIVLPVLLVALLGFIFAKRQKTPPSMDFINDANVMLFCPALVFSALLKYPVNVLAAWPLVVAGVLIIVLPGIVLAISHRQRGTNAGFLVPGMFRNTGNLGIPLMLLAYGETQMGAIVVLFVLSGLLHFSLGIFLLSQGRSRWQWLRNPNIWAALLGIGLSYRADIIPEFILTSADLLGQVAIPLMLFSLGVRLAEGRLEQLGTAFRINMHYLLASLVCLPLVLWLVPLTTDWMRLVVLSAMLPPAVLNFLLCEQYQVTPKRVANVVLLGNLMSVITIPLVVWASLTFI